MKYLGSFLMLLFQFFTSHGQYTQNGDTLIIGKDKMVSVQFKEKINVVSLADTSLFDYKINDQILILTVLEVSEEPIPIFVQCGDIGSNIFYSAYLKHGISEKLNFFHKDPSTEEKDEAILASRSVKTIPVNSESTSSESKAGNNSKPSSSSKVENSTARKEPSQKEQIALAINELSDAKRQYFSYGQKKSYGLIYLHSIAYNLHRTTMYLNMVLKNRSNKEFQIGNIKVSHLGNEMVDYILNSKKRNINLKEVDAPAIIGEFKEESIIIGIPTNIQDYTNTDSRLIIEIFELVGRRKFTLDLEGRLLVNELNP